MDIEYLRNDQIERAADARYYREQTGTVEFMDHQLSTSREARDALSRAAQSGISRQWKCADGAWLELSPAQLAQALTLCEQRVSDMFDEERSEVETIKTLDCVSLLQR